VSMDGHGRRPLLAMTALGEAGLQALGFAAARSHWIGEKRGSRRERDETETEVVALSVSHCVRVFCVLGRESGRRWMVFACVDIDGVNLHSFAPQLCRVFWASHSTFNGAIFS
jgi:hypothetical protein